MRFFSVCSGIEAASVAWEPLGWEAVGFSEIEPFPAAVLKHRYPNIINYGDMTKHEQWNISSGTIDLLAGGTPCQSFSVAGLRQGLHDPRGGLMLTFLEIAQRLRPRWIVWENVPGVLSSNGGRDFGSFLGALGELGFGWAYRILDAQWCGVAQRRRRVFVVGCLGDWDAAAKVLFERESVCRDTPPRRETGQGTAADAEECAGGGGSWWDGRQTSQTLDAVLYKRQTMPEKNRFPAVLQPVVTDRAASHWEGSGVHPTLNQSFNTGAIGYSDQEIFSQGGAGLVQAIPIHDQATRNAGKRGDRQDGKGNGLGVGKPGDPAPTLTKGDKHAVLFQKSELRLTDKITLKEVCPTLKAGTKAGDSEPLALLYENHPHDSRVTGPHEVAPSCVSKFGTGGGNVPLVQAVAFPIDTQNMTENHASGGKGFGNHGDPSFTITKGHSHAVAFEPGIAKREGNASRFVEEMSPTLRKDMGDNQVAVAVDTYNQALQDKAVPIRSTASDICHTGGVINPKDRMAVRRLTPRECERLQGFPDDWTLIPWRGKPADHCPDGPRYKALGNSMAVPCMAWIGKRINEALKA